MGGRRQPPARAPARGRRRGAARPGVRRGRLRGRKEISVRLPAPCDDLRGPGHRAGHRPVDLQRLPGQRRAAPRAPVPARPGGHRARLPRAAAGTGETIPNPCADCRGEGRRMEDRTLHRRGAGRGRGRLHPAAGRPRAAGPRGGPNGSLFVHLSVTPDPRFERQGDDLHTTLTVGWPRPPSAPSPRSSRSTGPST